MDFRCVTFSWRGTVYCARERTDRTKKKGERLPRVLSSAAAKGTKSLWSSRREKEKKEIKKGGVREREGKGEKEKEKKYRTEGRSTGRVEAISIVEYNRTAFSSYVSISEVARPPLFRREPQRAVFIQCNSLCQHCTNV